MENIELWGKAYQRGAEAYEKCPIAKIQIEAINITIYQSKGIAIDLSKELEIKKKMLKDILELKKSHACEFCTT